MFKNIVFDLGGVVVEYDPKAYLSRMFNDPALEELLYNVIFASEEWRQLDAGKITRTLAEQRMLEHAGSRRYEAQLALDDWHELMSTKLDTVDLIMALRAAGYHPYFLSNIPEDVFEMFCRKRRFMQLFEGGIPSYAVKRIKPDPEIFRLLLERYHLQPEETIFVDDAEENIAIARELGITGLQFKNAADLHKALVFLGIPVSVRRRHQPHPAEAETPVLHWPLWSAKKKKKAGAPRLSEDNAHSGEKKDG